MYNIVTQEEEIKTPNGSLPRKKEDYAVLQPDKGEFAMWEDPTDMMAALFKHLDPESFSGFMSMVHEIVEKVVDEEVDVGNTLDKYEVPYTQEACIVNAPMEDKPIFRATDQKHSDLVSIKLGKAEDEYAFSDAKVVVQKDHRYVQTNSRYYDIPNERLFIDRPSIKYPTDSSEYYEEWNDLMRDELAFNGNRELRRDFVDRLNHVSSSLEHSLPDYRKAKEDGYYHPYDSTGRVDRHHVERAYREDALKRALSAFEKGSYIGVFTKQLSSIERLSQLFPQYYFLPPLTNEKVVCILYHPYDRFHSDVNAKDVSDVLKEIRGKWKPWSRTKHVIFGVNNLVVPDDFTCKIDGGYYLVTPHRPRFFFSTLRNKDASVIFLSPAFKKSRDKAFLVLIRRYEAILKSMLFVSMYRNYQLTGNSDRNADLRGYWYSFLSSSGNNLDHFFDLLMPGFLAREIFFDRKFGIKKTRSKPHAPQYVRAVYNVLDKCDEAREEAFYPDINRNVLWTMVYDGRLSVTVRERSVFFKKNKRYVYPVVKEEDGLINQHITVTNNEIVGDPNRTYKTVRIVGGSFKDSIKAMTSLYDYDRGNLIYSSAGQKAVTLSNLSGDYG